MYVMMCHYSSGFNLYSHAPPIPLPPAHSLDMLHVCKFEELSWLSGFKLLDKTRAGEFSTKRLIPCSNLLVDAELYALGQGTLSSLPLSLGKDLNSLVR